MRQTYYELKLSEIDRLLNDPDTPLDAVRVWSLLAEIARHEANLEAGHAATATR